MNKWIIMFLTLWLLTIPARGADIPDALRKALPEEAEQFIVEDTGGLGWSEGLARIGTWAAEQGKKLLRTQTRGAASILLVVVLCGAVIPAEGPARVSLIDRRPTALGMQWLSDWLCARYTKAACVVIDGKNGVDVLIEKLSAVWKAKNSVIRAGAKQVVAAAGTLCDAVAERSVTWYDGQPILRESAVTATKRPIAGGWGFGGDDPGPVEACALALWGARTTKRDPTRRMKVG
jgi:hypothetical protein